MQLRQATRILRKIDPKYDYCTISQILKRRSVDDIETEYVFVSLNNGTPVLSAPTFNALLAKMKEEGIL